MTYRLIRDKRMPVRIDYDARIAAFRACHLRTPVIAQAKAGGF
jgi:hypothetical protein